MRTPAEVEADWFKLGSQRQLARTEPISFNRSQLVSTAARVRMSTRSRKTINNNGQVQNADSTKTRADQSLRQTRPGSGRIKDSAKPGLAQLRKFIVLSRRY